MEETPHTLAIALLDKFVTNLRYSIGYVSLGLLVILSFDDPMTIVRFLFAMGMMSFLDMFYYLVRERSRDFIYGIFYAYFSFFTLLWIFPYAVLTVRSRSWMTRQDMERGLLESVCRGRKGRPQTVKKASI